MEYVLDASVALKWFLPEEGTEQARALLGRVVAGEDVLTAPDLIYSEVGNGLRKALIGGRMTAEDARGALTDFLVVPVQSVAASQVALVAWRLVEAHQGTFYDALYVALAQERGSVVVAADTAMENTYRDSGAVVPLSRIR